MLAKLLPVAGLMLGISAPSGSAQPIQAAGQISSPIAADAFTAGGVCNYNQVMVGPSGTELAIWAGDDDYVLGSRIFVPSTVLVGRMFGPRQAGSSRFYSYAGGGLMFFPVRWSRNGSTLYARTRGGDERVLALNADGLPVRTIARLDAGWRNVDLSAIRHGEMDEVARSDLVARARRLEPEGIIRSSATLGDTLVLVGARRSDLELVRIEDGSIVPVGINAGQTRRLISFGDERAFEAGLSFVGAHARNREDFLPYQLPITDLATGGVVGQYGPTQISFRRAGFPANVVASFNRLLRHRGDVILDASASGAALALLTLSRVGERRVVRLGPEGSSERSLCTRSAVELPIMVANGPWQNAASTRATTLTSFAIGNGGDAVRAGGRPILMLHSVAGTGARDAVVYFHGGPGGTLADNYFPDAVQRLLRPGRDVLAIEYSGSQGGGIELTRRLPERGLRAIEEDVAALVRWLQASNYRRIYVVGASFGGVPALIAAARHPQVFRRAFFIAPYLRIREPAQWAAPAGTPFGRVVTSTQMAYELVYFGGPEGRRRFGDDLAELLSGASLRPGDAFYFGELDRVSQPLDLPATIISRRRTFPRMNHAVMLANDDLWRDIEASLEPATASAD